MTPNPAADRGERAGFLSPRQFALALAAAVLLGLALRSLWPLADPAWRSTVGVVWHDEGAWVHNARNRALFGEWTMHGDRWNPMYITPVLTGLEYLSFRLIGVGLWQARLVSEVMGTLAVLLLGLGVARAGGRFAGVAAAAMLATNFVGLSYDRAALMEGSMVALVVASWYCYGRASESPGWGIASGVTAILAFFTKASAVFFLAAIGLDALLSIRLSGRGGRIDAESGRPDERAATPEAPDAAPAFPARLASRAAWFTVAGLAAAAVLSLLAFVGPHWQDYRFYNWQMSVTRKPSYALKAFADRASWFPIVHDFFTRMWILTILAASSALGLLLRWRRVAPAERVLGLWALLGSSELVLHDVGNERRLVFLIPALVALAALAVARDRRLADGDAVRVSRARGLLAAPAVLGCLYVAAGSVVRLPFLAGIHAGQFRSAVRWSAAVALALGALIHATWPRIPRLLAGVRWTPAGAIVMLGLVLGGDLVQFSEWARIRTYKNYEAMVAVGRWLPPGTLVQGKLANGLDLENGIRPIFVGRGFGNYADRLSRTDVRYLLTYVRPSLGYESQAHDPVIRDILDDCPGWKILCEFDVAESPSNADRAALIDKYPERGPAPIR